MKAVGMETCSEDAQSKKKVQKAARLIVRNLSFNCKEEDIQKYFSKFGTITEITLLKKNGRLMGCGFIQFDNKFHAAKAIGATSGVQFMGRPIIVDWAVPKHKFHAIKQIPEAETQDSPNKVHEKLESKCNKAKVKKKKEFDKNKIKNKVEQLSKTKVGESINDNLDGRTVFFKEVPFQVTNEDLKKCAEELAGPVEYAVICVDPLTEHSKGTGFVRFKEKNIADKVLCNEIALHVFGKNLLPYKMLNKDDLEQINSKKRISKDKRNLYLVKEGSIKPGSQAAKDVSQADMNKRIFLDQLRSKALRNLHKFVSPTRLIIYNLPFHFDNKKLLTLFKKYSPKGTIINEARVMRNLKDVDQTGVPKSKGYGFVSFENHEDALTILRAINNNPAIFTDKKRPIVAFSVENKMALFIKQIRQEKMKKQKTAADEAHGEEDNQKNNTKTTKHRNKFKGKKKSKPKKTKDSRRGDKAAKV